MYLSDVSHIPEDVFPIIQKGKRGAPVPVCVLDCLRLQPHTSHMGLAESIAAARKIGASRTYLTGFGHEVSHEEYVTITEYVGMGETASKRPLSDVEKEGIHLVQAGAHGTWVRPAHDGLKVVVAGTGSVVDTSYF